MPLGLYLHIPFCRKRCHFCYFRVYTDKNAERGAVVTSTCSPASGSSTIEQPAIAGRPLNFVYFGGGTPSYISTRQLESLVSRMDAVSSWRAGRGDHVRVRARNAQRKQARGHPQRRRHPAEPRHRELRRCDSRGQRTGASFSRKSAGPTRSARSLDFPQINIDLIAGMLGETDENWQSLRREDHRDGARQRDHLPDGAAVQHDDQQEPVDGRQRGRKVPTRASPAGPPSDAG